MSENDIEAQHSVDLLSNTIEYISSTLFQINNNINNIQKLEKSLETRFKQGTRNNEKIESRIMELMMATNELFKDLNESKGSLLNDFVYENSSRFSDSAEDDYSDRIRISKNESMQRDKILREIASSFQVYQELSARLKSFIEAEKTEGQRQQHQQQLMIDEEESAQRQGQVPQSSSQQQIHMVKELDPINNEELVYHARLVAQRESEIANIQTSINELNTIFKDLDHLVSEQGYLVDNIEDNIMTSTANLRNGHKQLQKADKSQRRGLRTKKCLMLVCAVVVMLLIMIVLALS